MGYLWTPQPNKGEIMPISREEGMKHPLTTAQAAASKNVAAVTIRLWLRKGWLKGEKVGRDWLIDPADLEQFKPARRGPKRKVKNVES